MGRGTYVFETAHKSYSFHHFDTSETENPAIRNLEGYEGEVTQGDR